MGRASKMKKVKNEITDKYYGKRKEYTKDFERGLALYDTEIKDNIVRKVYDDLSKHMYKHKLEVGSLTIFTTVGKAIEEKETGTISGENFKTLIKLGVSDVLISYFQLVMDKHILNKPQGYLQYKHGMVEVINIHAKMVGLDHTQEIFDKYMGWLKEQDVKQLYEKGKDMFEEELGDEVDKQKYKVANQVFVDILEEYMGEEGKFEDFDSKMTEYFYIEFFEPYLQQFNQLIAEETIRQISVLKLNLVPEVQERLKEFKFKNIQF